MKVQLLTLLLILSLTGPAWARLGENEDQLNERYGNQVGRDEFNANGEQIAMVQIAYRKTGFDITVTLFNGVSAEERISNSIGDPLTDQQIRILLDANAQGNTWRLLPGGNNRYQRDDGAIAKFDGGHILDIRTKALMDAMDAAHKTAHTASLDGF